MRTRITLLLLAGGLIAQAQTVFRTSVDEVLLDFVVRDMRQRLVRDLTPDEVEVYEDGVRQKILSFRFVGGAGPEGTTLPPGPGDPLREINLVTIVFEAMTHNELRLARQVAREFLDNDLHSNTWVAIFTLNRRLALVQPYTQDVALLRTAVDKVSGGNFISLARDSAERVGQLLSSQDPAQYQPVRPGSAEDSGPGFDRTHPSAQGEALNRLQLRVQRSMLRMLLHQEGSATLDALRTLIRELAPLPGRKTVLYLSDGLTLPPNLPGWYRNVVAEANRGNVSFYTVDTSGLETASQNRLGAAPSGVGSSVDEFESGGLTWGTNQQQNLFALAEDTGGFAMANSNDLRKPVRRVMEEVRSHYEMSYVPSSTNFDGHFRRIEIKLRRSGLRARSRDGYFALPAVLGRGLLPYEYAVLRAMESRPNAFPFRAAALRMRPMLGSIGYTVVLEIPTSSLRFNQDAKKKTFSLHASVLALIRDETGQVVAKISRDLPWTAPAEKIEEYRAGNLVVRLPVDLEPGRYALETGVVDRVSASASVRRSVLLVAAPEALPVSDAVLVRRHDSGDADAFDPLALGNGVITPDLSATARGDPSVYFAMWPRRTDVLSCTVELRHNGRLVAKSEPELPAVDVTGTVKLLIPIRAASLGPGQCELTATFRSPDGTTTRTLVVNLE